MKKLILALVLIVVVTAVVLTAPVLMEFFDSESHSGNDVTVTIPQGAAANEIARILKENNIIEHEAAFRLKLKFSDYNQLNWGTFVLNDGMCIDDVLEVLSLPANAEKVTFVVPEGFSVQNIAQRAESLGLCSEQEFLDALGDEYDYEFIKYIKDGEYDYKLQGFLFPDTYSFTSDSDAYEIIDTMLSNFDKKYTQNIGEYDEEVFETIIKASLIEKEAKLENERPIIAGVIENRLEIDMLLQLDAAVVYAVTDGIYDASGVSYNNLEVESPYNIYKNKGLTPGPICNPGISAIKAAANPQHHNYLYYHTDNSKNDGSHIFTETYEEHLNTMN